MHELSIDESIVRVAGDPADGRRVAKVYVKVGHLRQVVHLALSFSFDLVAHGTPVERSLTSARTGRGMDEWRSSGSRGVTPAELGRRRPAPVR